MRRRCVVAWRVRLRQRAARGRCGACWRSALRGHEVDGGAYYSAARSGFFDPFVLIEEGRIALDEPVPLFSQRKRGIPEFAAAERRVLDRVVATLNEGCKAA